MRVRLIVSPIDLIAILTPTHLAPNDLAEKPWTTAVATLRNSASSLGIYSYHRVGSCPNSSGSTCRSRREKPACDAGLNNLSEHPDIMELVIGSACIVMNRVSVLPRPASQQLGQVHGYGQAKSCERSGEPMFPSLFGCSVHHHGQRWR